MRLFWYIFKDYLKYVIGTLVLCMFLFVLFDFIHKTTKYFAQYKPSSDLIFQMYLYQLPMHISQALPIASLLASVITMVLLSRTNEITAMRAAGKRLGERSSPCTRACIAAEGRGRVAHTANVPSEQR
jgi:lipopolysaccharide export system permease protein